MDWPYAINRHRDALLRIVAGLFALAGLAEGGVLSMLPRPVYRAVLLVLRPAESALRRLVVMVARELVLAPGAPRAAPVGLGSRGEGTGNPSFGLIDPLKRFKPFAGYDEDDA